MTVTCALIALIATASAFPGAGSIIADAGLREEPSTMMRDILNHQALALLDARQETVAELDSPEAIRERQEALRAEFIANLGGFPERTALNARITGEGTGEGYRYEKIIFESRPGYPVTGVLFLPLTPGPWPGVIVPCGHSNNGKAAETYQRASILLARHGIAAFCYDPIGQGERYYFYRDDDSRPLFGPTLQHTVMGVGAILTGSNLATYRIWDGIRALDYLESRDDIDPERLACAGNSGGGTLTAYIMALDDRVSVAAPSCYITSFRHLVTTIGPQDAEQNIFRQLAFGMDHSDYLFLRAPKPTLVLCATHDYFAAEGTWEAYRENVWVNTQLSSAHTLAIAEANANHGFSQPLREMMVQWMQRWLLETDEAVHEPDFAILDDEEMMCTPTGRVIDLPDTRSIFDLIAEDADRLAEARAAWQDATDADGQRAQILALLGARAPETLAPPAHHEAGTAELGGLQAEKLVLEPEPGVYLPAVLLHGEDAPGAVTVFAAPAGQEALLAEDGPAVAAARRDGAALVVDLRGLGETSAEESHGSWTPYVGHDWQDYYRAYLVGKSYVGMRTEDLFQCAAWLAQRFPDAEIRLWADGITAVPALHAAALAPGRFAQVHLATVIPSWDAVARTPRAKQQLVNTVHNALAYYDLPTLRDGLGDRLTVAEEVLPVF